MAQYTVKLSNRQLPLESIKISNDFKQSYAAAAAVWNKAHAFVILYISFPSYVNNNINSNLTCHYYI